MNIKQRLMSPDPLVRASVAAEGQYLDRLIHDSSPIVRGIVVLQNARRGLSVTKFINDPHWFVRYCLVCCCGDRINEVLMNDRNPIVKSVLAYKGYKLDKFINDKSDIVRARVAAQGYGLDRLIKDPSVSVRIIVANQNYGLETLINDLNRSVRITVADKGYGLDKLINDPDWQVRKAVAEQGYGLDKLVNDKCLTIRLYIAGYIDGYTSRNKDSKVSKLKFEFIKDPIISLIRNIHYNRITDYDKCINHKSPYVREAAAKQGYGLDQLVNDDNWYVRAAVADQGYGLDKLVNDPDWQVRQIVASKGYGLDKLIDDKHFQVRINIPNIIYNNILKGNSYE